MIALATHNNTWTLEEMADQFGPIELHKPLSSGEDVRTGFSLPLDKMKRK